MEKASKVSEPSGQKSIQELKEFDMQFQRRQEVFAATKSAIQISDLTKTESRTFSTYSKEKLRNFMKNPKQNEANLRNLSRFLYRLSQPYRRLISHNAQMMDLTALSLIPEVDITQPVDAEKMLKQYADTAIQLDKMNLANEIYKLLVVAWREDTVYGFVYEDDQSFFIHLLDGDYCRVSSTNYDSTLNFAFDFSYFRNHAECLEYWDSSFKSAYNKYNKDNNLRWQELDPARTICLKVNSDDPLLSLSPFCALFENIIDLIDLQSLQAVKDELSVYKLLIARLEHMQGSTEPDDFELDINTAIAYYNKLADSLPDYVAAAISPMEIEAIDFKDTNNTANVDMIANSMSNLFRISGGSLVLNDEKQGTTIYEAHILSDTLNALRPLLGQVEAWVNRYLTNTIGEHAKVKYHYVSPYTKKHAKDSALTSAQNGLPEKLYASALDGFSPLESLSLMMFENDVLKLHEKFIPLSTSYTQSGMAGNGSGGAPTKDADELTDEGSKSREESKSEKG